MSYDRRKKIKPQGQRKCSEQRIAVSMKVHKRLRQSTALVLARRKMTRETVFLKIHTKVFLFLHSSQRHLKGIH